MVQNTSGAVMARRIEPQDSLDDFPTPPWGSRVGVLHALYRDDVPFTLPAAADLTVWEPAANRGHMVRPLRENFGLVFASDAHDYGCGFDVLDFLSPGHPMTVPDLVMTNPPFGAAAGFVRRAMQISRLGCAVLVRGTWLESRERYELCQQHPPALVAQFAERLPMIAGYIARKASTASAYAWVVFLHGHSDTRWRHIPPCRRLLERADDYPEWAVQARLMGGDQLGTLLLRHANGKAKPPMPEAVIRAELLSRGIGDQSVGLRAA